MSMKQEFIVVTVGNDSDNSSDVLLVENSGTVYTESTVSTDGLLPRQHFQGDSGNSQPTSQTSNGVERLTRLGDQLVSQMNFPANLRRYNPNSELIPLNKNGPPSVSKKKKVRNASGIFDKEKHRNQLLELQRYCEGLQDLNKKMSEQLSHICEIISKRENTEEKQSLLNRASPVVLTAREPSLENIPEMMGNHSMGLDTASSSVYIPHNFEIKNVETKLRENSQMMNSPPFLGNKIGGQDIPNVINISEDEMDTAQTKLKENSQMLYNPPFYGNNNGAQDFLNVIILSDEEIKKAQTNLREKFQMMNSPPFLGNKIGGQDIPNVINISDDEMDTVQIKLEDSSQMIYSPSFFGYNNGAQDFPNVTNPSDQEVKNAQANLRENSQMMNSPPCLGSKTVGQDIPKLIIISDSEMDNAQIKLKDNSQMIYNPSFLRDNNGAQDFPEIIIVSDDEVDKAQTNWEQNIQIMNNPTFLGNNHCGQNIPRVLILSDLEMDNAQTKVNDNSQLIYNPPFFGDNSGAQDFSNAIILSHEEMDKAHTTWEENIQMMNNPRVLGNNNGVRDTPSVLNRANGNSSTEMKSETMMYPTSMENVIKQGNINSEYFPITSSYNVFVKAENNMESSHGTMISPVVLESDNSYESSSSSDSIPLHMGYLGDPERNVTIHKSHLVKAQGKSQPKHAARYLVRNLFSKEVLICSTVRVNFHLPNLSGLQPLDPNILAAIREYLTTIFPNHDLRECGKDWRACISYINCLIRYECSVAKNKAKKAVVTTKCKKPASADLNVKKEDDGGEGSSQLSKKAPTSETREIGNSQPNSIAVPEGFEEPSTGDAMVPFGELTYIGHPSRNVMVSYSVLSTAKRKACPQMSANYLISQLFPEEVLINSSVYGNLCHGTCALDSNMINAIREFLQDSFPSCDLSEHGSEWKMCVTSMNCYMRILRQGCMDFTSDSPSSQGMAYSLKSESSDTELSD